MPIDILEDFIAFTYATGGNKRNTDDICPVCGATLEVNDNDELYCPECED